MGFVIYEHYCISFSKPILNLRNELISYTSSWTNVCARRKLLFIENCWVLSSVKSSLLLWILNLKFCTSFKANKNGIFLILKLFFQVLMLFLCQLCGNVIAPLPTIFKHIIFMKVLLLNQFICKITICFNAQFIIYCLTNITNCTLDFDTSLLEFKLTIFYFIICSQRGIVMIANVIGRGAEAIPKGIGTAVPDHLGKEVSMKRASACQTAISLTRSLQLQER